MKLIPMFAAAALLALPLPGFSQPMPRDDQPAQRQDHRPGPARDKAGHRRDCPPGLAKKSDACVPPGHARKAKHQADRQHHPERIVPRDARPVRDLERYGLRPAPRGQRYYIVDGKLVRVDTHTNRILSVIRSIGR